jgi:hypothetical protein
MNNCISETVWDKNQEISRNLSQGFVKVYRSMMQEWWYRKPNYVHLYLHLLLLASYTDSKFKHYFKGQEIRLKPGQFITGRKELAKATGIKEGSIEGILKKFESRGSIQQQKSTKSRLISISNWSIYQKPEQQKKHKNSDISADSEK